MPTEEQVTWLRRVITNSPGDYYRRPIRINHRHPEWTQAEVLLIGEKPATPFHKQAHTVEEIVAPAKTGTKTGDQIGHFLDCLAEHNTQVTNVCIYSGSVGDLGPAERRQEYKEGREFVRRLIEFNRPTLKVICFHGRKALDNCAWRYFTDEAGQLVTKEDLSIHTSFDDQPLHRYFQGRGRSIALYASSHFSGNYTQKRPEDIAGDIETITKNIKDELKQLQTLDDLFKRAGF